MHCFSSSAALARAALDLGFYLSMSGIAAFPKSQELRDIFAAAPLDRILVETDSPYLAPPPHRGKRNEPAYIAHTARVGAALFGLEPAEFARADHRQFRPPVRQGRRLAGRRMSDTLRMTILGCGSSGGVPRLGGHWGDCDPDNPHNRRRRCSLLVERIRRRRHHPGADRHRRPTCARNCSTPGSGRSTRWSIPMPMPITCTGSTICA